MKVISLFFITFCAVLLSFTKSLKISSISINDNYIVIQKDTLFSKNDYISYRLDSLKSFKKSDLCKIKESSENSQKYFLPKNGIIFYSPIKNGKTITSLNILYGEKIKGVNFYNGTLELFSQKITRETIYKEILNNENIDLSYLKNDLKANGHLILRKNKIVVSILFNSNSENSTIKSISINW